MECTKTFEPLTSDAAARRTRRVNRIIRTVIVTASLMLVGLASRSFVFERAQAEAGLGPTPKGGLFLTVGRVLGLG